MKALWILFGLFTFVWASEPRIIDRLDLSPEQVQYIRTLQRETQSTSQQLQRKVEEKESQLKVELSKPQPVEIVISKLTKDIALLQQHQLEQKIEHFVKMKQILNADQLKELERLQRQRRSSQGNGNGRMGGRGRGGGYW